MLSLPRAARRHKEVSCLFRALSCGNINLNGTLGDMVDDRDSCYGFSVPRLSLCSLFRALLSFNS